MGSPVRLRKAAARDVGWPIERNALAAMS